MPTCNHLSIERLSSAHRRWAHIHSSYLLSVDMDGDDGEIILPLPPHGPVTVMFHELDIVAYN